MVANNTIHLELMFMLTNDIKTDYSENNYTWKGWKKLKNVNGKVVCVDLRTDKTLHAKETYDEAETENWIRGLVSANRRSCFTGSPCAQRSFACEEIRPDHRHTRTKKIRSAV